MEVGGQQILVKSTFKYLGVMVDSRWKYHEHVRYVTEKADRVGRALQALMPNLRGPGYLPRVLYANVVQSVLLYAVPVWSDIFKRGRTHWRRMETTQRRASQRAVSAYRTVSATAAGLLAGIPPIDILAKAYTQMYEWRVAMRKEQWSEDWPPEEAKARIDQQILFDWELRISSNPEISTIRDDTISVRIRKAFEGLIAEWRDRSHGRVDFWISQMFTGHGSFGAFAARIKKSDTARCWHCPAVEDTVQHTLEECPAWNAERTQLQAATGLQELDLNRILECMLDSEANWRAFATFSRQVMRAKLRANFERQREANRQLLARRGGRGGARGRMPRAGQRGRR